MVLHYGHYYALRLPPLKKHWPQEWAVVKDDEIPLTQDVENHKLLNPICRGGGRDAFTTPKKARRNSIEDDMLRTCSSVCSEQEDLLRTCDTALSNLGCSIASKRSNRSNAASSSKVKKTMKKKFNWTCPICAQVLSYDHKRKETSKICKHLQRYQYAVWHNAFLQNHSRNTRSSGLGLPAE